MPVIKSQLNPRSEEFRANAARMKGLVADLREKVARVTQGGDEASRKRHVSRGKLLPRERVRTLLDPGSPFLEVGQLAAYGMYGDEAPGAGIITGIGRIAGRRPGAGRGRVALSARSRQTGRRAAAEQAADISRSAESRA